MDPLTDVVNKELIGMKLVKRLMRIPFNLSTFRQLNVE